MRVKSIKEAEWVILNYLIEGDGANMSDVIERFAPDDDAVQLKRFITASDNIRKVLVNMRGKRTDGGHKPKEE